MQALRLTAAARDGQHHILRESSDPVMVRFYRGYYNLAVERRPEFWVGVYSKPALLDLEGMELVIGNIPKDFQFNPLRRYCGNYAQAAKAMFEERATRIGEIRALGEKTSKVAGVRTVKPADPVCHNIREYATWPQQVDQRVTDNASWTTRRSLITSR